MSQDPYERLSRRLKLRALRILLAIDDHGSFRRAGQHLYLTQPAITSAIADLEATLGVRLFDRTPQGVIPTEHGERFIRRARGVMGELRLASDEIEAISSGAAGTLRVGSNPSSAAGILVAAMTRLIDRHPHVTWSVREGSDSSLVASLKARDLDLLIAHLPEDGDRDPELAYELLYADSVCVWASRSHPLATRERVPWADLVGERWIRPDDHYRFSAFIEQVLHREGVQVPRHVLATGSIALRDGMLARADSGLLGFGMRMHYEYTPLRPLLATLNADLPPLTYPYAMVTLKGRVPNPLGGFLRDEVRGLAALAARPDREGSPGRPGPQQPKRPRQRS